MSVTQQTINRAARAAQDAGALLDSEIGAIVWLPGQEAVHIGFGYPVRPAEAKTVQLAGGNEAKNPPAVLRQLPSCLGHCEEHGQPGLRVACPAEQRTQASVVLRHRG